MYEKTITGFAVYHLNYANLLPIFIFIFICSVYDTKQQCTTFFSWPIKRSLKAAASRLNAKAELAPADSCFHFLVMKKCRK